MKIRLHYNDGMGAGRTIENSPYVPRVGEYVYAPWSSNPFKVVEVRYDFDDQFVHVVLQ